jgi:hypothetical protein
MLTWREGCQGSLTALMSLCLAKLHLKINKRARAEENLAAIPFSQPPEDAMSEFHASLGDIHYARLFDGWYEDRRGVDGVLLK